LITSVDIFTSSEQVSSSVTHLTYIRVGGIRFKSQSRQRLMWIMFT